MPVPNLSKEEDFYFYINDNVKDDLTELMVSIVEDYGNPDHLQQTSWYQVFFKDETRSKNIKSFWSVSQELAHYLIQKGKLVSYFHGLQVWACEHDNLEDALEVLRNPNNLRPPLWTN